MKKFTPPLLVPLFFSITINCAIADNMVPTYTTVATNFTIPYNLNYDFKMNAKENIPYLTTITQGNNSKTLKLWQMQEVDKSVTTIQVATYPIPADQDPKNLHLALGYLQNNGGTFPNQYMAYIDKNHQNSLVILQTYSNGMYINLRALINETYPIKNIDAMDMAVEKDGNLIVATVDNSRHVHLYKYITQFYGTAPEPITLIGDNSQLVAPLTANPDQLKLALIGPDEVPHVVFPYTGTDKNPVWGRIAAAYVTTWHPNAQNSSAWSIPYIADFHNTSLSVNGEANSPINIIASPTESKALYAAFHTNKGGMGIISFNSESSQWGNALTLDGSDDHTNGIINDRYPVLATNGKSIYGLFAQSNGGFGEKHTTANLFTLNQDHPANSYLQEFDNRPSERSDVDNIKYTGLVMHSQDFPRHYLGFVLTQDGDNSSNLVIKGITNQSK